MAITKNKIKFPPKTANRLKRKQDFIQCIATPIESQKTIESFLKKFKVSSKIIAQSQYYCLHGSQFANTASRTPKKSVETLLGIGLKKTDSKLEYVYPCMKNESKD